MKNLLFLSFIFLFITSNIFAEWEIVNYQPDTYDLYGVDILNPAVAIAVGNFGLVRKTNDSGKTWSINLIKSQPKLSKVVFLNENIIIAFGDNGKIFRTDDGGENWNEIISGSSEQFNSIYKVSSNIAYITGSNGLIIKTTDAGFTWQEISTTTSQNLNNLFCNSDSLMLVVGDEGTILRSINLGNTWEQIPIESKVNLQLVRRMNPTTFFATGDSLTVLKTVDAGLTWNKLDVEPNYSNLYKNPKIIGGFFGLDSIIIFCVQDLYSSLPRRNDYSSTDFGKTWSYKSYPTSIFNSEYFSNAPNEYKFYDDNFGLSVGIFGIIDKVIVDLPFFIYRNLEEGNSGDGKRVTGLNKSNIALVHIHGSPIHCLITTDAGDSWFQTSSFDRIGASRGNPGFYDIAFPSANNILIGMNATRQVTFTEDNMVKSLSTACGYILRSVDTGKIWSEFLIPDSLDLVSIIMKDSLNGFLKVSNKTVLIDSIIKYLNSPNYFYRTNDGAASWEKVYLPDTSNLNIPDTSINYHFLIFPYSINDIVLQITMEDKSKKIYISHDRGNTWEFICNNNEDYNIIYYLNDNKAFIGDYIVDSSGRKIDVIKFTEDSGISWHNTLTDDGFKMSGIKKFIFSDNEHGIALTNSRSTASHQHYYYYTENGGKSWKRDFVNDKFNFKYGITDCLYFEPGLVYFYSGNAILIRSDGTIINVEEIVKNTNPEIGIFPNPISNNFNIYFYLTEDNTIDISIYDMTGKILLEPVKSVWYGMGGHNLNIDCRGFIPGSYFAVLKYNGNIISSKFIVR